jgi:histidine ammonia-lyase
MLLRYATAARYTRLRQLADPVTLDVPSLDLGIEDHATNAPEAVQRTQESLDVLEDVLAAELLVAYRRLNELEGSARIGLGTTFVVAALSELLGGLPEGVSATLVHERTRRALTRELSTALD